MSDQVKLELHLVQRRITRSASGQVLRLVKGPVLRPDIRDRQGTTVSADEIQKAAYDFMARYREGDTTLGFMHKDFFDADKRFTLVESAVLDVDYTVPRAERVATDAGADEADITVPRGSWILGVLVHDDDVWSMVEKGTVKGFSIGGTAKIVPDKV